MNSENILLIKKQLFEEKIMNYVLVQMTSQTILCLRVVPLVCFQGFQRVKFKKV